MTSRSVTLASSVSSLIRANLSGLRFHSVTLPLQRHPVTINQTQLQTQQFCKQAGIHLTSFIAHPPTPPPPKMSTHAAPAAHTPGPISPEVQKLVDDLIAGHKVTVFAKSFCPFSKKAKETFAKYSNLDDYFVVDIDLKNPEQMPQIQDYLLQLTGARSVPRVFIGGKFFGGGDDTVNGYANGTLTKRLEEVGALPKA